MSFPKLLLSVGLGCLCAATSYGDVVLRDTFDYADGPLTNVSDLKWRHHGGTAGGEVNVTSGQVQLTAAETEDVNAPLTTTFGLASDAVVYTRFTVTFTALPTGANGDYFAHFNTGSHRARIFATTNTAAAGKLRIGLSNGSATPAALWPTDVMLGSSYTIVTRLVVSNALATLWLNPLSEQSSSVSATDIVSAASVSAFSLRQSPGIGALWIDDVVVATTFDEVMSANSAPRISGIADQFLIGDGTIVIPFTVGDAETPSDAINLRATSSNESLIPSSSIQLEGLGSNRTASISCVTGMSGTTTVSLCASDGAMTNCASFQLTVATLFASEDFAYSDGPLAAHVTWLRHSGATNQLLVLGECALLDGGQTEDVHIPFAGGGVSTNAGTTLFASFRVTLFELPSNGGDYFAHLNSSTFRCRLFAQKTNAATGTFRLGIANGASTASAQHPLNLRTNADQVVVLRYDVAGAISTLWVNPLSEADASVTASDPTTAVAVNSFSLRQDPGIGNLTIDDLRVGASFAAVTGLQRPRLQIQRSSGAMTLRWPAHASDFAVQTATDPGSTNWQTLAVPVSIDGEQATVVITNNGPTRFYRLRQ